MKICPNDVLCAWLGEVKAENGPVHDESATEVYDSICDATKPAEWSGTLESVWQVLGLQVPRQSTPPFPLAALCNSGIGQMVDILFKHLDTSKATRA